jgi:alpha-aminoadipic semialdehyde synthase
MSVALGIRREDKNQWERRVPLTPEQVGSLIRDHGLSVIVQPSELRVFPDGAYREAGALVQEDLSPCRIVLGVKEMPASLFRPGTLYVFFSHTIKGQSYNMAMLRALMGAGAHLMDYERIVDSAGRRLVLFGRYAGLAGMIESLHALGRRLAWKGCDPGLNPFLSVQQPYRYETLENALDRLKEEAAAALEKNGVPESLGPVVIGVLGYGNVARGALEVLDACFPVRRWKPRDLLSGAVAEASRRMLHVVVFEEKDTVRRSDGGPFDLQDYYAHPEKYRPALAPYLPHLTVLINAIYWDPRYPVLVTADNLREVYAHPKAKLQVIGDITCDIEGSIAVTRKATSPSDPCYVYDVETDALLDGMEGGRGSVIMAVDNLPCEFPREASEDFGKALMPFLPNLCRLDLNDPGAPAALPDPLKPALIVHRGELAPDYAYLKPFLT